MILSAFEFIGKSACPIGSLLFCYKTCFCFFCCNLEAE